MSWLKEQAKRTKVNRELFIRLRCFKCGYDEKVSIGKFNGNTYDMICLQAKRRRELGLEHKCKGGKL